MEKKASLSPPDMGVRWKATENNGVCSQSSLDRQQCGGGVGGDPHILYFANVKVPVETLALKDINVDLGHP